MSRPGRAKLSTGHVRTVRDDASSKLGISAEPVVLETVRDRLPLRAFRGFLQVATGALVVAAALYVALAVTVVAVMGSGDKDAIVVRGAFPGGIATPGEFAFMSEQPYDRSVMGKVEQAFVGVPGGSTIEILARPGAKLTIDRSGQILADQLPTKYSNIELGKVPQARLGHEYLAVCVAGSGCRTGELIVVPDNRIVGKVSHFIGFTGLADPTSYRH